MDNAPYITSPRVAYPLLGVLSFGLMAGRSLLPGRALWGIHTAVILVCNLWTLALALRRGQAVPSERTGWRCFAGGVAVAFLGNLLWLSLHFAPGQAVLWRLMVFGTTPAAGLLMALGVWHWPWRGREGTASSLYLLGSLVFCLSFLLLPWIKGVWSPLLQGQPPMRILLVTLSSRLILVGGLASFLVAEEPRRLRGPLGWLLLNCCLLFLQVTFVYQGVSRIDLAVGSPWLALTPLITGALLMVPCSPRPVEAPATGSGAVPSLVSGCMVHLPFLMASTLIVVATIGGNPPGPAVLLVFLLMTAALVLRQFLLQEQLAASHRDMEARVLLRTRELESLQDVVLLNERLNAVVVLGAGLVHDLNKGLGSILSAAEVLQMELERRMKVSGFAVEAIIQAVERSAILSSRVMDFSRRLQEDGEVRDLRRELAALEGLLKLLVPCGIHLLLLPGQEPAPVRIHTEDLKQILLNLVANARDALPEGGTIRVAVGRQISTGETFLDVEDTGTGISPEHRASLFEPFFTTKGAGTATGLGLASVKILLDKAQGRVEVSTELGTGTRFRLLFPAPAAPAA